MANKLRITHTEKAGGDVYTVPCEDGVLHVFDTCILARGVDGKLYVHNTFVIKGWVEGPEGSLPNRDYKGRFERFAAKVEARGVIDLAHWSEYREQTWAEREAYNLRCEAEERASWR
jgi:hypothetical protein